MSALWSLMFCAWSSCSPGTVDDRLSPEYVPPDADRASIHQWGEGARMRTKSLLALLAIATLAAAVVVGLGASAASAGEVTGNCNNAGNATAADNCKGAEESGRVSNGNSWCSFSGQNDNPDNPITDPNPGGKTQNWGQDVSKNHVGIVDPSQAKGNSPSPGTECNPTKDHNLVPDGSPPRK